MNSTNETLLFDRFLIMHNLCVFTCIIVMFVFHCTHVRMSYVLNSYLLTYLLKRNNGGGIHFECGVDAHLLSSAFRYVAYRFYPI